MHKKIVPAALLLVVASLGLAGCKTKIDASKVEESIKTGIKEQVGAEIKTIECPKDLEAKTGDTFECKGTTTDGTNLVFLVTDKDDKGNIAWKVKSVDGQTAPAAASGAKSAAPPASASASASE